MDRYKYSVTPFSPIKELIPGTSIRAPFTADLNKDEVFMCMKHGPVYRLFPGKAPIKVTGSNFEDLHVAKYGEEPKKEEPVKEKVPVVENKVVEEAPPIEEGVKIFDREEIRENFAVQTPPPVVEEENLDTVEEEPVAVEEIPVESGEIQGDFEWAEGPIEDRPVEEVTDSEDATEEEETPDVGEGPEEVVEAPKPREFNPQYKPNYSKKNKKHKNHN